MQKQLIQKQRFIFWQILLCWWCLLSTGAQAYSYAAAGNEPLIDGRESLLSAINKNDWLAANQAFEPLRAEILYLTEHHDRQLLPAFEAALNSKDGKALGAAMTRAFVVEIDRRLTAAGKNISDFQVARGMVVKSHRLFQATAGDFAGETRTAAENALNKALEAIGNPGVFGVGAKPADSNAFEQARKDVATALNR